MISTGGTSGTSNNQGSDIAVGPDGAIYVAYNAFERSTGAGTINIDEVDRLREEVEVSRRRGSGHVRPGAGRRLQDADVRLRLRGRHGPTDIVYVAYQSRSGDYDVYVQRSTDGGATWGAPVQAGDDPGARHQIFPDDRSLEQDVARGLVRLPEQRHAGERGARRVLRVHELQRRRLSGVRCRHSADVSHNGNYLLFGGGTAAFHGDYNELDARWDGANHIVHVAWADNRNVSPCDLDPAAGPASNNTGNRNQNISQTG